MHIYLVPLRKRLTALFNSPLLHLVLGFMLIACAGAEVIEPWIEGSGAGADVGTEHGIVLLGLVHGMKALIEFFEGVEKVREVRAPHQAGHEAT